MDYWHWHYMHKNWMTYWILDICTKDNNTIWEWWKNSLDPPLRNLAQVGSFNLTSLLYFVSSNSYVKENRFKLSLSFSFHCSLMCATVTVCVRILFTSESLSLFHWIPKSTILKRESEYNNQYSGPYHIYYVLFRNWLELFRAIACLPGGAGAVCCATDDS